MMGQIKKSDDKKLMSIWFLKDDNQVPSVYQLQPVRQKLEHFGNSAQPDKMKKVCRLQYMDE